jgi:protein O-mannosyl-transferase
VDGEGSLTASPIARVRLCAAIIVVAGLAAYANAISIPFVLDDESSVVQNPDIRSLTDSRVLFPTANSPTAGRPLVSLSFALNYAAGQLDPRGYHAVNLALHLLCALLVFGLVRRTLLLPALAEGRFGAASLEVAFAAALLWVVHPLTSEVMNYVTQRTESMMALCLLATVYASLRAYLAPASRWHGAAIVACLLGALCKETMVVAPLLVVCFDRAYLYASWREAFRERISLYLGLAASWFLLASLIWSGPRAAVGGFSAGVEPWTYLLNQSVVIVDYLRLAVWPVGLVAFYGWPQPVTFAQVAVPFVFVATLMAATAVAVLGAPRVGFLGLWFFVVLAPTSSIVPIATEVGAERRMYLPLVALVVLAVLALWRLAGSKIGTAAAVALALALGATTAARNREYATPMSLAQTIVDRRPSGPAHHMLGEQLAINNRLDEAVVQLQRAVDLGNTRARYQLGRVLMAKGDLAGGASQLEAVVRLEGVSQPLRWLEPPLLEVLSSRLLLGQVYAANRRWAEAEAQARAVLARVPAHVDARRILAASLAGQQRWPESIAEHRQYLQARPGDAQAHINLGVSLVATGQLEAAAQEFRLAVRADPANAEARRLLGLAEEDLRQLAGAGRP